MSKFGTRAGAPALLLLFFAWLCSGGVVTYESWPVASQSYRMDDLRPWILVRVESQRSYFGIPFVWQHISDKLPFGLSFDYTSRELVEDPGLVFDDLTLEMGGTRNSLLDQIPADALVPKVGEFWKSLKDEDKFPCLRARFVIRDCIPKRQRFVLRMNGRLTSKGRVVQKFATDLVFTPQYESHIFAGWVWRILS